MKTPIIRLQNLLLVVGALAVAGCNSSSAESTTAAPDPLAFQPAPEIQQVSPAPGEPAAPLPLAEPKLDFTPSPNLANVLKLARAGVSESLMLKFVQNAPGTFGLGAQEIICLNDLGVSENVINTMMERDRATAAAAPAPAPNPVVAEPTPAVIVEPAPVTANYFYETLSPYGAWIEVAGYGRCWQPTVIAYQTDWQPYGDRGHWIYTDYGWYWASDYSWGNVAFHYGRWFRDPRRGWCWSPDNIWAPAWVSWRHNNDYCGWAPLPPAARYRPGIGFFYQDRAVSIGFDFGLVADSYIFVSRNHFTDFHPRNYATPRHEVTQIFNRTIVNNHYSGGGGNNHVFNHGIAPAVITAGTANQIRPVHMPAPAAPKSGTPHTDRSVGTVNRNEHENFPPRNRAAATPSRNPVPTQPLPAITAPPRRTPTVTAPPVTVPPADRGNSSGRNRDASFRSQTPAPVSTPATSRSTPAPAPKPVVVTPRNPFGEPHNHYQNSVAGETARAPQNLPARSAPAVETPRAIAPAIVTSPSVPHNSAPSVSPRAPEVRVQTPPANNNRSQSASQQDQSSSPKRDHNDR